MDMKRLADRHILNGICPGLTPDADSSVRPTPKLQLSRADKIRHNSSQQGPVPCIASRHGAEVCGEISAQHIVDSIVIRLIFDTVDMNNMSFPESNQATTVRPRPALFLALGHKSPPAQIHIEGVPFKRIRCFKHDSWAATAVYQSSEKKVVVKFNRQQPVLGIPMKWLGRALARREHAMLERLADVEHVPSACGAVSLDGCPVPTASGHDFVEGRSLLATDSVDAVFFARLSALLGELHRRGIAYVDLHKRDNILVDQQGRPHLIDFQISIRLPQIWPLTWVLRIFQRCDRYHLEKHKHDLQPDQCEGRLQRPVWIRAHRLVAVPFRQARRWLLVKLGIRKASGMADSEFAPQEEFRKAA